MQGQCVQEHYVNVKHTQQSHPTFILLSPKNVLPPFESRS